MTIAPARRRRATTSVSAVGTWSRKSGDPYVVRIPAVSSRSLTAMGRPCSRPAPGASGAIGGGGLAQRQLRVEGDDRVERGVDGLDAPQMRVHHLGARQLAVADRGRPAGSHSSATVRRRSSRPSSRGRRRRGVTPTSKTRARPRWTSGSPHGQRHSLHAKLRQYSVMAATVHHTPLVYVESDIPEGVTLAEWRRSRRAVQARRASVLERAGPRRAPAVPARDRPGGRRVPDLRRRAPADRRLLSLRLRPRPAGHRPRARPRRRRRGLRPARVPELAAADGPQLRLPRGAEPDPARRRWSSCTG